MTTKPKTRKAPAPAAKAIDPIFALIAEHKALAKKICRLYKKLDDAECEARKAHGMRPFELIPWRNYSMIGASELDRARREFLSQRGADRKQIEREYLDAKERLCTAKRAGIEWDHRAGIAPLRKQIELARCAEDKLSIRMARMKPTTPAGAAAMIDYARRDIMIGLGPEANGYP